MALRSRRGRAQHLALLRSQKGGRILPDAIDDTTRTEIARRRDFVAD